MKSPIVKRSVVINGHKTSISLEDEFWSEMKTIAAQRHVTLAQVVSMVDDGRGEIGNLSSALRCFVLSQYFPSAAHAGSQQREQSHPEPQAATP
jgi:predicted DNA-binding ribbon-helix-helix protein